MRDNTRSTLLAIAVAVAAVVLFHRDLAGIGLGLVVDDACTFHGADAAGQEGETGGGGDGGSVGGVGGVVDVLKVVHGAADGEGEEEGDGVEEMHLGDVLVWFGVCIGRILFLTSKFVGVG